MDVFQTIRPSIQLSWESFYLQISKYQGNELRLRMEAGLSIFIEDVEYYLRWSQWRFVIRQLSLPYGSEAAINGTILNSGQLSLPYGSEAAINGTILNSGPCISLHELQDYVDKLVIRHIMGT